MVRNAARHAIGFNDFLNLSKFVRGHGRKQMVFDLAGQPARAVIDSRMSLDVPAGEHLLAKEVYRRAALQQRHALMIRRKYQRQIQSQEHLLRHEEQDRMPTEEQIKQAEKPARVQNEETHFDDGVCDLVAHQEFNAVNFQHKGLKQRQRKETEMLVSHREPCKPALPGRLVLRKCKQGYVDVGIACDVIRRAMMRIVLVQPPTVAESEQQIGMDEANDFIAGGPAENFLMACVVNDETQLSEDEGQKSGVEKFRPRVMKPFYEQERGGKQNEVKKNLSAVVRRLLGQ